MLQSLRLIWTISRGFNKDERMGPLLQKIAWALYDRVIRVLHIPTLFRLVDLTLALSFGWINLI